jgi:phage anti-repressor protein
LVITLTTGQTSIIDVIGLTPSQYYILKQLFNKTITNMVNALLTPSFKLKQFLGMTMVSAKELYDYFEITEDFQLWGFRMLRQHHATNDYVSEYRHEEDLPFDFYAIDHLLTIECAKDISLQQNSKKGRLGHLLLLQVQNSEKSVKLAAKERLQETSKLADKEFERLLDDYDWIGCIADLSEMEKMVDEVAY